MSKNEALVALSKVGQSVWYDNLSRDVLASGELKKLIDSGVLGLTSNPTIFKKAIADSSDYDTDIRRYSEKGVTAEELCEELMIQDVATAADLLKEIYTNSKGEDGCASIEVSPFLARDSAATVTAAKRIWGKLNRPNVMIKIPGTPECLPAIKAVLEAGINVNVTLLFNTEMYEKVVEQYIAALEARHARGEPINNIASVASFFVSRVDAIVEKNFETIYKAGKAQKDDQKLFFGKVGIANARVAYARFEELFNSARFKKLKDAGAKVQRPLWASTGTKNPVLSPLLYVEELAGPQTVNTMPPATLEILLKGARISNRLSIDRPAAREVLATVNKLGMNFNALMQELQDQGVDLFAQSYKDLLDSIEVKRKKVSA